MAGKSRLAEQIGLDKAEPGNLTVCLLPSQPSALFGGDKHEAETDSQSCSETDRVE